MTVHWQVAHPLRALTAFPECVALHKNTDTPPDDTAAPADTTPPEPDAGLPPDPMANAPPIAAGEIPTYAASMAFLLEGPSAVQSDLEAGALVAERLSVIRGVVQSATGEPLPAVRVEVMDAAELGFTETRADGAFDLVVNGGDSVLLLFRRAEHLPAQRMVKTVWNRTENLDPIVLRTVDPVVSHVDLSSPTHTVARGSVTDDDDGLRQPTLLVPPGTSATYTALTGETVSLDALDIRFTEYTVGPNGPSAMPSSLPPASAYTYAVEISVDEVLENGRKVDGKDVILSQPIPLTIENFLGFPVGSRVPVGYYDADHGRWVAYPDGRVIGVLGDLDLDGAAELDLTGAGAAADAAALAALGVSDAERATLLQLHEPGTSLWRVQLDHFSTWDCNWPYGPEAGASRPSQPPPRRKDPPKSNDPCDEAGSVIECETQTLIEQVQIVGTPLSLVYRSDRVHGRRESRRVELDITGAAPPAALNGVDVRFTVNGQTSRSSWSSTPNQTVTLEWDGRDAYGRPANGLYDGTIQLSYVYDAVYMTPAAVASSFAQLGGAPAIADRQGLTIGLSQVFTVEGLGMLRAGGEVIEGWTLSNLHSYDHDAGVLMLGTGERRDVEAFGRTARHFAGDPYAGQTAPYGDGGPKEDAFFDRVLAIDFGPDGSLYVAEFPPVGWGVVRRITPDGVIKRVAGLYGIDPGYEPVGRPATGVGLASPQDIDVDATGSIVICGDNGGEATIVDPDGYTWPLVDQQPLAAPRGDGGPAIDANLKGCDGIVRTSDGTVFIADKDDRRVRRIGTDGIITTAVGGGTSTAAGTLAAKFQLSGPTDLTLDLDENLLLCDGTVVRRVDAGGVVSTIAGGGAPADGFGDGLLATQAKLLSPTDITVGPDGTLYIASASTHRRLRAVGADGIIRTIAGNGTLVNPYTATIPWGLSAPVFPVSKPTGVAVSPSGQILLADEWLHGIIEIGPDPVPVAASGEYLVPSQDGAEIYTFDASGRHLTTLNATSGEARWTFGYQTYGDDELLVRVTDHAGLTTTLERQGDGTLTALVGPYGHRTTVTAGASGFPSRFENPAGEATSFTYDTGAAEGLLLSKTDPGGGVHTYGYDEDGRLVSDASPTGRTVALVRTETSTGHSVSYTTSDGRSTVHAVSEESSGAVRRTKTDAMGGVTQTVTATDGTATVTYPDARTLTRTFGKSERFGGVLPMNKKLVLKLPSGLTTTVESTETVTLTDPNDLLSLETVTQTSVIDGKTYTRVYDVPARSETETSPAGRTVTTTRDAAGRVSRVDYGDGTSPLEYAWDEYGRLASVVHGDREKLYTYDAWGRPTTKTWGARSVDYAFDAADRLVGATMPDGAAWSMPRDADGHKTAIVFPSGASHALTHDAAGRLASYTPPGGSDALTITRRLDGDLDTLTDASGVTTRTYDAKGRLATIATGSASIEFTYAGSTDRIATLARTPTTGTASTLAFEYDSSLVTKITGSGVATFTSTLAYDARHAVTSLVFSAPEGSATTTYSLDADGLRSTNGAFTVTRGALGGAQTGMTDGVMTLAIGITAEGLVSSRTLAIGGSPVASFTQTFDDFLKVSARTETVAGASRALAYGYDGNGRLATVARDGAAFEAYGYDLNGNRTTRTGAVPASFTFDARDRLTSSEGEAVAMDGAGRLVSRGADTFTYGQRSELLSATVSGVTVSYDYDGYGRLVRRTEGSLVRSFFYAHPAYPLLVTHSTEGGALTRYTYDEGGALVAFERGGTTYYVATDLNHTPRAVFSAAGAALKVVDVDAFGQVIGDSDPTLSLAVGFAGGIADETTGFVRFGFRDYDPRTGRFTTTDPALFATDQLHLYVYGQNDPVNRQDPTGLVSFGFSAYAGPGGGAKLAFDKDHASLCFEVGFGAGAGVEVSPTEGAARDGQTIKAEAGVECGPASLMYKASLDDCGKFDHGFDVKLGPLTVDTAGDAKVSGDDLNQDVVDALLPEPEGKAGYKCKPGAKLAGEICRRLW